MFLVDDEHALPGLLYWGLRKIENDGKGETLVLMIQAKTGQLNAAKFSQHYI